MANQYGLRLVDRPGVSTYQTIVTEDGPLPGQFHPDIPTPVGDEYAISLEDAKRYDKDKGIPLKLEEISTRKANQADRALAENLNTDAPDGASGTSREG